MKKFFLLLFFVTTSFLTKAQIYSAIIGDDLRKDAEDIIAQMIKGMNLLLDNAIAGADYVTEARLKEVGIMLDGVKNFVHNERVSTLDRLDDQRLALLKGLDQMMSRMPSVEELHDLAAILTANMQDLANSFGTISNETYLITRINGMSLEFKKSGLYRIGLIGNIFNKENIVNKILVNGKPMELRQGSDMNQMYVTFPSSEINSYFNDTIASRIPIQIISIRTKRILGISRQDTLMSFSNTLLLHPKYPFQYRLTEIAKNITWSEPFVGEKFFKKTIPNKQVVVTGSVADGYKIDSASINYFKPGNVGVCPYKPIPNIRVRLPRMSTFTLLSNLNIDTAEACEKWRKTKRKELGYWVDKPVVYNEGKSIRRTFFTTSKMDVWIEVYYRKPITSTPLEIQRKILGEKSGFLTYGVHESEFFSEDYASYTLKVKPFYEDWIIINPTAVSNNKAVQAAIESGAIKRLTIKINPQ